MTIPDTSAKELRKQLRLKRQQLSHRQQLQHAQQAFEHLKKFLADYTLLTAKTGQQSQALKIACFLTQDGELRTHAVIEYLCRETEHRVFIPTLESRPGVPMAFVEYQEGCKMENNRFGMPEPKKPVNQHLSGEELDIVIMPLVGFDLLGNRLGMGGGYYDQTFAFKLPQQALKQAPSQVSKQEVEMEADLKDKLPTENEVVLIGWAHSCQQVPRLPNEAWDVPLDGIITELGFHSYRPQSIVLK